MPALVYVYYFQGEGASSCPVSIARVTSQWTTVLKTKRSKSALEKKIAVERFPPIPQEWKVTPKDALVSWSVKNIRLQAIANRILALNVK